MPSDITLRAARADEAALLTELALRSKGHWAYPEEFLVACRDELTVSERLLPRVTVAEVGGQVCGFALLATERRGDEGELAMLFVDPPWIGKAVGGVLMQAVLREARSRGLRTLVLDADPGAQGFYERYGATKVGVSPSGSIPDRVLPRMRFTL
ncbi:GNAT family N-acetyltransferase [Nocardioides alcanivorans]|uniref:GNAT family N-acetyltransferase n=1 Tax=Nocardioides alcanivorans TaxID=2897352 RepID=UPI001F3B1283|nr:GNAT family N-acetyltransferase [Nocardioides alcanivorans]